MFQGDGGSTTLIGTLIFDENKTKNQKKKKVITTVRTPLASVETAGARTVMRTILLVG